MEWLDIIIRTNVNDPNAELRLYKFVKTIRFTEIPKRRKYKKEKCRFRFRRSLLSNELLLCPYQVIYFWTLSKK